jgi:hypothetical protein
MGFARERSFFRGLVERYKRASYRTIAPGRAYLGLSEVAAMLMRGLAASLARRLVRPLEGRQAAADEGVG